MDALSKNDKIVLAEALRLLFDKSDDFNKCSTISDLATKFKTKNADEIKNDLQFITSNPF